jgi:hypothetical protein
MKKYFIIVAALIFVWFAKEPILAYSLSREVSFTVSKTERVTTQVSSKYIVWSKEGDVYENVDSVWFLKFNSSDVQGKLLPDTQVTAKVTGLRFGFFSWYPNIISVKDLQ